MDSQTPMLNISLHVSPSFSGRILLYVENGLVKGDTVLRQDEIIGTPSKRTNAMKKKINSLTAGGQARSEIFPGDIFRDNRGERVTVKIVADNRITYIREGYSGECVFPVERFRREFWPVKRQTFSEWCESNNTAEKIHNLRALIAAKRAGK